MVYNVREGGRGTARGCQRRIGGGGTSSSQPSPCVDQTDGDYDPDLEDIEMEIDTDIELDDLWERGPTGLPPVPTREEDKIVLTPKGDTQWDDEKSDGRLPNGILGVLVREAFPGIVKFKGNDEPAWKWEHYNIAEDALEAGEVHFGSALERVEESFWWWFKWADNKEIQARRVVRKVVKKLIPQMFYEGRIQSVITYHKRVLKRKITRAAACKTELTLEQYMQAIPWWAQKAPDAWELAAKLTWCNEDWKVKSHAAKARRAKMRGASHRQGSCSFPRYKKKLIRNKEREKKRPVSDIEAYTLGRMGDQEGTFCNLKVEENLEAYTEAVKELHGPEFDTMNAPLDQVAVYKAGNGKKHGRYLIGDGFIDTRSTLSEVGASGTGSQDEVRPRRRLQTDPGDRELLQQEIESRKILEMKLDKQMELTDRLQEGYSALVMIIQTHLNIPIPPLVLAPQTASSQQGTSGGSNASPATNVAARDVERELSPNEAHVDESTPIRPN